MSPIAKINLLRPEIDHERRPIGLGHQLSDHALEVQAKPLDLFGDSEQHIKHFKTSSRIVCVSMIFQGKAELSFV